MRGGLDFAARIAIELFFVIVKRICHSLRGSRGREHGSHGCCSKEET